MSETYYKVWVHVEKINEDRDLFEAVGEPVDVSIKFKTIAKAKTAQSEMLFSIELYKERYE